MQEKFKYPKEESKLEPRLLLGTLGIIGILFISLSSLSSYIRPESKFSKASEVTGKCTGSYKGKGNSSYCSQFNNNKNWCTYWGVCSFLEGKGKSECVSNNESRTIDCSKFKSESNCTGGCTWQKDKEGAVSIGKGGVMTKVCPVGQVWQVQVIEGDQSIGKCVQMVYSGGSQVTKPPITVDTSAWYQDNPSSNGFWDPCSRHKDVTSCSEDNLCKTIFSPISENSKQPQKFISCQSNKIIIDTANPNTTNSNIDQFILEKSCSGVDNIQATKVSKNDCLNICDRFGSCCKVSGNSCVGSNNQVPKSIQCQFDFQRTGVCDKKNCEIFDDGKGNQGCKEKSTKPLIPLTNQQGGDNSFNNW